MKNVVSSVASLLDQIDNANDLNTIIKYAYDRQATLNQRAMNSFKIGDRISWKGRRWEGILTGTITKVNQTTLSVKADSNMRWKVQPTHATLIK